MAGAHYYRTEAERCRKRAADDPASESAKRWLQLAAEYEQLADALEAQDEGAPVAQQRRCSSNRCSSSRARPRTGTRRKPRLIETEQRATDRKQRALTISSRRDLTLR